MTARDFFLTFFVITDPAPIILPFSSLMGATKDEFKDMGMVRAKYAERYFMAQGIDPSRITIKSMGAEQSSKEIADVDEDELKSAKNRRVEFSLD